MRHFLHVSTHADVALLCAAVAICTPLLLCLVGTTSHGPALRDTPLHTYRANEQRAASGQAEVRRWACGRTAKSVLPVHGSAIVEPQMVVRASACGAPV